MAVTTIGFVIAAASMLAAVGWLIGREIARATDHSLGPGRSIVAAETHHAALKTALHTFGTTPDGISLLTTSPSGGHCVHVEPRGEWLECRPSQWTPQSYALFRTKYDPDNADASWSAAVNLLQRHCDGPGAGKSHPFSEAWKHDYDTGHHLAFRQMPPDLPAAHARLQRTLSHWPEGRDVERAVAMTNLAYVCLALPEPPTTRLARLLEGHDAARQALQLHYSTSDGVAIEGLRPLMRELQSAISQARDFANQSGGRCSCPQANVPLRSAGRRETRKTA